MLKPLVISRVVLRNYKSIRHCDVRLEPITFLVGPNGAGKSNFVEALRFLSFGLSNSLEQAVENRSGLHSILHRGPTKVSQVAFEISFRLGLQTEGTYFVAIEAAQDGPIVVAHEECIVHSQKGHNWFKVSREVVESNQGPVPAASEGKLYLVNASGLEPFEPVYRALSSIVVYNPVPDEIRGFKSEKRYRSLDRTGSVLAEIIFKMKESDPEGLTRISEYLQRISPEVRTIDALSVNSNYSLQFEVNQGRGVYETFSAQNISDGTLRALAVLVGLFQRTFQKIP